ncbi:MAG: virginiamycin B lyase family protein [Candidatus Limnocylindria bacterium]
MLVAAGCTAQAPGETASPPASASPSQGLPSTFAPAPATESVSPSPSPPAEPEPAFDVATYPVPPGSRPHDVAPAADGGVWYTAQHTGQLGWLDPQSGEVREIPLGPGSAPHGVIVGPDDAAWVTDGGQNAIVRVDAETDEVTVFPLDRPGANLNTAAFDGDGVLWFTGQAGIYGSLDPASGAMALYDAPRGPGPYGIAATPDGEIVFSSLAGSYLGLIDRATGGVTVVHTPTQGGGARRVWSDSAGRLWVTEWFAASLAMYDPDADTWAEWPLPEGAGMPYAVYVDERDAVWVTDFSSNSTLRFDPAAEAWTSFEHASQPAEVRQLLGREGEVWGAESAADQLAVIRAVD